MKIYLGAAASLGLLALTKTDAFVPSSLTPVRCISSRSTSTIQSIQPANKAILKHRQHQTATQNRRTKIITRMADSGDLFDSTRYTEAAFATLAALPFCAESYSATAVDAPMLLSILLNPTKYQASEAAVNAKAVAVKLLEDAGVDVDVLQKGVEDYLERQPKVTVTGDASESRQKSLGNALKDVMETATEIKSELKDSYISSEVLLLGLCAKDTKFTINALNEQDVSLEDIKAAVTAMREKGGSGSSTGGGGAGRVTSRSAEGLYDALEKYGIDFTGQAEEGKLDPVIGRDDEIRRAIQILSRRTKNNPVLIGDPGVGEYILHEM